MQPARQFGGHRSGHRHHGGLAGVVGELDAGLPDPFDHLRDQLGAQLHRAEHGHHVVLGQAATGPSRPDERVELISRDVSSRRGRARTADRGLERSGPIDDHAIDDAGLAITSAAPMYSSVPSPSARLPTWPSPRPRRPDRPAPGPSEPRSAASCDRLRRRAGLHGDHRSAPGGPRPAPAGPPPRRVAPRLLHRQPHQQGPHLGWRRVDGLRAGRRLHQRLEGGPLEVVAEQGRLQPVAHLLGPVDGQSQRLEPGPELAGTPTRGRAGRRRRRPGRRLRPRSTSAGPVEAVGVPAAVSSGSRTQGSPGSGRRSTPVGDGEPPAGARSVRPRPAGTRARGPSRRSCSSRSRSSGGLQPAPLGHLHHVLVPHQVVGVLGHRGQGGVGRPGPALGGGQVGGSQDPLHPELEEGLGPGHGRPQAVGIGAGQLAGVRARREGGHGHVELELALPLVEAAGGRLAGAVGVEGQHHPGGEVPAAAARAPRPGPSRRWPRPAPPRPRRSPMTSVYPSQTTTSPGR